MTYSIIQKSQLEGACRLDAEYYQPEYLNCSQILQHNSRPLKDLVLQIKHPAEIKREYEDAGIPFLLTQNISSDNFILKFQEKRFINKEDANKIPQNKLKKGDVVMTRTGANYGDSAVYLDDPPILYASAHVLIIRPKNDIGKFLATYLNSKVGRSLVKRGIYGTSQPEISPEYLKELLTPTISDENNIYLSKIINRARQNIDLSENLYFQAEEILLKELGLKDFQIKDDLFSIVSLEEVKMAERIDAEYFQKKYQQLFKSIRKHDLKILDQLVTVKKGIEPGSEAYQEEGKQFIRVSSLSKFGIEQKDQQFLSDDLYQKFKKDYEPKVGEILLTKDATPGIAYTVKEPIEGIISGGIVRLSIKSNIEPEYLTLCINSIIGKWQAERDSGGSVIAHWKTDQIKNLLIPILPIQTQQKIVNLVKKSHEARKKSKELLEEAKQKVEEMIEKSI